MLDLHARPLLRCDVAQILHMLLHRRRRLSLVLQHAVHVLHVRHICVAPVGNVDNVRLLPFESVPAGFCIVKLLLVTSELSKLR